MGFFSEGNKSKGKDSSGIVWTNTIAPQSKEHYSGNTKLSGF